MAVGIAMSYGPKRIKNILAKQATRYPAVYRKAFLGRLKREICMPNGVSMYHLRKHVGELMQ